MPVTSRHRRPAQPSRARRDRRRARSRRGVASVLSMMFLILFGSLAAAMAIASKSNIQTAATHLHVSRAISAAETGLALAQSRIADAAARFVIANSTLDATFAWQMWCGTAPGSEPITVLPPRDGPPESPAPRGLLQALANAHARDVNIVPTVAVGAPTISGAMAGVSTSEYKSTNWLYTPAIALEPFSPSDPAPPACFTITYAPLANGTDIRAIVTGYDFGYARAGNPITRTIMQDFRMSKRVRQAILSPSKIMLGKNVAVTGDLGARYTRVTATHGDPLVMRSDFLGIDTTLDTMLNQFFAGLAYDVDRDNRLRVGHPTESLGIPDFDGSGSPDGAAADRTGDGYVDEFDVFLIRYDANKDGKVVLSAALIAGTPAAMMAPEFVKPDGTGVDDDLALLIDSHNPDRNRNGVWGYNDLNGNGRWDPAEPFLDVDPVRGINRDQVLGYRDGVIDRKDQYAKVSGKLTFKVSASEWTAAQGDFKPRLRGPIKADRTAPVAFGVPDSELPPIGPDNFVATEADLKAIATGSFWDQVASERGVSVSSLATFVETRPPGGTMPRFLRLDGDANGDNMPDNWATVTSEQWEPSPFNSPSYSDMYYRPVFENMEFKNVTIPMGLNALFKNCTFAGVTYIRTHAANAHVLWGEYGKMKKGTGPDGRPVLVTLRTQYFGPNFPTAIPSTARNPDGSVWLADPALDEGDVRSDREPVTPNWRDLLPDPLIVGGRRITDTKPYSNNIRFHNCTFVGSIVSDKPGAFMQSRNKLQFTGATKFHTQHPTRPTDPKVNPNTADLPLIKRSSMMLPQYSVDIGTFNSPQSQDVRLQGAVIAGVLDIRGNTSIDGVLMLTFDPTPGTLPLLDPLGNPFGNPAGFNATIGYFGPDDGDSESLDPNKLPIGPGGRIVGYDTSVPPDGIPDEGPTYTGGGVPVYFNGYGKIAIRFDPKMALPNGIMLPMTIDVIPDSYREGKP